MQNCEDHACTIVQLDTLDLLLLASLLDILACQRLACLMLPSSYMFSLISCVQIDLLIHYLISPIIIPSISLFAMLKSCMHIVHGRYTVIVHGV